MAMRTELHYPIDPPTVDQMDLTTIAALMGVGREDQIAVAAFERYKVAEPERRLERKRPRPEPPSEGTAVADLPA